MCIILPLNHIPCTHTTTIWQHCIDAIQCGPNGLQPCSDVKQRATAVLTRRPCEDCSSQRHLARRGGVAERGNGSPIKLPESILKTNDLDDDADSGYHSDVIHEEDEDSDRDEYPLSPKALAPPQTRVKANRRRKHGSSNHRALTRKPSWKPNLKRDLNFEYEPIFPHQQQQPRRDSIDSLLYQFDAAVDMSYPRGEGRNTREDYSFHETTPPSPRPSRRLRNSTLLHPSSPPPAETTHHAQMAQSFQFPQIVEVRRTSPSPNRPLVSRMRKNSTLLHPSSPTFEPASSPSPSPPNMRMPERRLAIPRRASSLLHPSHPDESPAIDIAQHRTVMSIPPRSRTDPQRYEHARPERELRRMPPLQTTRSEPTTSTTVRRKKSVLHSCLSDGEDEGQHAQRLFGRREGREREAEYLRERGAVAREGRRRG